MKQEITTMQKNIAKYLHKSINAMGVVLLLSMTACGGGGNSSEPPQQTLPPSNPTLTLLAGDIGGEGNIDGLGDAARFVTPSGIAVDSTGNLYVADSDDYIVRKISPTGEVMTIAGSSGNPGSSDGIGTAASFDGPGGVAVDDVGNVYVADSGNHTIRKISPTGEVSTFAGEPGIADSTDGVGAVARFNSPQGLAIDTLGNLYVADSSNHIIRMITPTGVVTTIAGMDGVSGSADGAGTAAQFNLPFGIALDVSGNIYVADTVNHTIRKIDIDGVVSTLAGIAGSRGSEDSDPITSARFSSPHSVTTDTIGNVFVADSSNHTIRKINSLGEVMTYVGAAGMQGFDDGNGVTARLNYPYAIVSDASNNLYLADAGNNTIRRVTPAAEVTTLAGAPEKSGHLDAVAAQARFSRPRSIVTDVNGNAYIADGRVYLRQVMADGDVTTLLDLLSSAGGLAIDTANNIYIADTNNHVIRKLDTTGSLTILAGTPGVTGSIDGVGTAASFNSPAGVAVDASGNIYVADSRNHIIRMITTDGTVTTLAGLAGNIGSTDGTNLSARFNFPQDVVCDASGTLYVTDRSNHTVRKITINGMVSTFAGAARSAGAVNGIGMDARFYNPQGIGIDSVGNLYVADTGNHVIRKISPAGDVITVVGTFGKVGVQFDELPASLYSPRDVSVSADGELLIVTMNAVVMTNGYQE